VRRQLILASLAALITGCGSNDAADRSSGERSARLADRPHHVQEVGRWRVAAHVEPREVGPLAFSVASLQAGRSDASLRRAPVIRGKLGLHNTGDASILLKPIDYAAFSEDAVTGNQLLLTEGSVVTG
jgi:hypothetical protein